MNRLVSDPHEEILCNSCRARLRMKRDPDLPLSLLCVREDTVLEEVAKVTSLFG